jgi:CSLREA domain-containing protein
MPRTLIASVLSVLVVLLAMPLGGLATHTDNHLRLDVPARAERGSAVAFQFRLPRNVSAVDGRLLIDTTVAEVIGLAPVTGGHAFRPELIPGGVAFGAYGLKPQAGHTVISIVLAPLVEGRLQFRVVIDSAADRNGRRLAITQNRGVTTMRVAAGGKLLAAPQASGRPSPSRPAGATRDLVRDGTLGKKDLDVVRYGWELARINDATCGSATYAEADANDDGCVDIVDVQAVFAAQGERRGVVTSDTTARGPDRPFVASLAGGAMGPVTQPLASAGPTFVVDSTVDTPDAKPGDGVCADTSNRCTLRAAITESNWWPGANRIEFNLAGTAPVRIQLSTSPMSIIQDRSGGVTIDGYSQPGSRPNTAAFGSNAIPGIEIRGTGESPRGSAVRIYSPGNTVRGILFNNFYRPIVLEGSDARANRFVGNWIGYTTTGSNHSYRGNYQILLDHGANNNLIGTPDLADRNVSGNGRKALSLSGAGTDDNIVQNNLFCTAPNGSTAVCSTGVDMDNGPKRNLVGGPGTNERNVIGRTTLQGIEVSHGYSPDGTDTTTTWQNNHNRVIGNWVGFRPDGSYDSAHRSGQNNPGTADNGNGINVYDGSNFNVVEGNWVASVYDGIQTMSPNSTGNIIRNNVIGESPLGQAAPLTRRGIVARRSTQSHVVEGNIIRNAALGGIGLTHAGVRFVRLSRNIVTDTSGPAIYLAPDPSNPATGANNNLPAPVITSASTIAVAGTGIAGATVELYRASRSTGQSGLPVEYLGSALVATNGTWSRAVALQATDRVTALQIHPNNNTSALGINVAATFEAPPDPPVADFTWGQQAGSLTVNFSDTSTGSPASWSWDFGDGSSSTEQNPTRTYASAGEYTVTLTTANAGGSDSMTRTVTVTAVNPPTGSLVAADAFGRTASNGWGNADVGGAYTLQGTLSNYGVSGGMGNITLPAANIGRSALLNEVSATEVDLRFRVKTEKVPTGGASFLYAVVRRNGTNEYRPRLILNANGSVSVNASVLINGSESSLGTPVVVPGLTQAAGSFIWLRAQVTGTGTTTIRVKAWADGQAEPTGWLFTATNNAAAVQTAGSVGLRIFVSGSVNNAPITFGFDDYQVAVLP